MIQNIKKMLLLVIFINLLGGSAPSLAYKNTRTKQHFKYYISVMLNFYVLFDYFAFCKLFANDFLCDLNVIN